MMLKSKATGHSFNIFLALIFLLLFSFGCNETVTLGVKSSGVDFPEVRSYLPLLEDRGATLYQEVREADIGSQALVDLLEDAEQRGIRVVLWPLLRGAQGPWANEHNAAEFGALVVQLMDWMDEAGLHPEWIAVNMENSIAQMEIIREHFENGDYGALAELLLGNLDPEGFADAVEAYAGLVDGMHERGFKVMVTTYPFMMDDFSDGDADLQDMANVPLDGIDWDALTFTTYRTAYSGDLGVTFNPSIVYEYGRRAVTLFGDRARLAVGMIGETGHGAGYDSPDDLALDIAAAKAAGITEVDLFHLGGMIDEGGPAAWLEAGNTPARRPAPDLKVYTARLLVSLADALLDGRRDPAPFPGS